MKKLRKEGTGFIIGLILGFVSISMSLMSPSLQYVSAAPCTNWAGLQDDDCDGLANLWENTPDPQTGVKGFYDPNGDGDGVSLPGANSQHKDLFVEIDYMTAMVPLTGVKTNVVNAFAGANVWNPDGTGGIKLNLVIDSSTPIADKSCTDIWPGFNTIAENNMGTATERAANPLQYQEQKNVKFYGIFIREQCGAIGSSGNSENPGDNFVVSLGSFSGGSRVQQESTLMHELGHDLGLNHGGSAPTPNCKPNYLSVMNWGMQFADDVPGRRLDYSRSIISSMPETSLNEPGAIGASVPTTQPTAIGHTNPPAGTSRIHAYNTGSTNLNYNWYIPVPSGDNDPPYESNLASAMHNWGRAGCWDNTPTTLYGYWDWAALRLWTWSNDKYVNIALSSTENSSSNNQSSDTNITMPSLNSNQSLDGNNQSIACNPLDQTCSLSPCDPKDTGCTFEKRTNFTEPVNATYDYGNRSNSHTDQTFDDVKAVHHDNLMDFNNRIQTLSKEAFSDTTNATDVKHDFEVKIVTGNNSLIKLVEDNDFNGAVLKLNELKDSLPALFIEPYLTQLQNNTQFLIAGLTNMIPDNGQSMVQQK